MQGAKNATSSRTHTGTVLRAFLSRHLKEINEPSTRVRACVLCVVCVCTHVLALESLAISCRARAAR
eukprot:1158328-Pelagomonas_calceolata.AAC.6